MPQLATPLSAGSAARVLAAFFLGLVAALSGPPAAADTPSRLRVFEYYNAYSGQYFLTAGAAEIADIAAGSAGPGWAPTGWAFDALPYPPPLLPYCATAGSGSCRRVFRLYHTLSHSHFYTADPAEAQGLERDPAHEWFLEQDTFAIPVPGADGRCPASEVPVYRLYNNGFAAHDIDHRYVTDAGERAKMVAKGWYDEGVRFCALGAEQVPIKSFAIANIAPSKILPSPVCEDESVNRGACLAVNNLAAPSVPFPTTFPMPRDFFDRTGLDASHDFVESSGPASALAQDAFVQLEGTTLGIHVATRSRGTSPYTSVNPLYQFHSTTTPGTFDDRFFPWTGYESDTEIKVSFTLNVKTIDVIGAGSAAYGHPTLEFIDQRSGHHLYFTVLTYDNRPISDADYLAFDPGTGKVIVGTAFRASSPYLRPLGLPTLHTPSGFNPVNYWGLGGYFEFRMDRDEFQRVVNAARTLDPALSSAPADYLVDNFHFNNEVYGDGDIGLNLADYTLSLMRR